MIRNFLWTLFIILAQVTALQAADQGQITVTDGSYTIPSESLAVLTLKNKSSFDLICNVKIVGVIRGKDPETQASLTGRQASEAIQGFILRAGREQERRFNFVGVVNMLRGIWGDPNAVLVEVDPSSLSSDCSIYSGGASGDEPSQPENPDELAKGPISHHTFRAYIRIGASRNQVISMQPELWGGHIQTDEFGTSSLEELVYSNNASSLTGDFTLGATPYHFEMHLLEPDTGRFEGKVTNQLGQSGSFFGYYVD